MSSRLRRVYFAGAALHFALIGLVCLHGIFQLVCENRTLVPAFFANCSETLDCLPSVILGDDLSAKNPYRQVVSTYLSAAGVEVGYGYFAPNIPATHALLMECHYSDGRVDLRDPATSDKAAALRLTTLIEHVGRTDYEPLRTRLIKLLVRSNWGEAPAVGWIRAFFGTVDPPSLADYRAGKMARTFNCLNVYDFRREAKGGKPAP